MKHQILYAYLKEIKKQYMDSVVALDVKQVQKEALNDKDTVTLFHGTTTERLNSIIRNGILPRKATGISNWEEEERKSIETVTYLTDKWHYFYAYRTMQLFIDKKYGRDFSKIKQLEVHPCYIECKVPKTLLVMDEDFLQTRYMKKKLQSYMNQGKKLDFDPLECLEHYGTVGVLGGVPASMIVSFTVLGEPKMWEYVFDRKSPYYREYMNWQLGKGKGHIKREQLWQREAESNLNGTWWIEEVKNNKHVSFGLNPSTGKIAMVQS